MEQPDYAKGEVLLIDKPYKWTSFDVVNYIRKVLKVKLGHAGTLDPLATGLLILCTGAFTKKIESYMGLEKEYTGTITLGATTPSFDLETAVDKTYPLDHVTNEMVKEAALKLTGDYDQIPPLHSAKWIDGERAYHKARRGEETEVKARAVSVPVFEIVSVTLPVVEFRVVCGKGTYIRSLARDLGIQLNTGGYLSSLRRTRIGNFHVDEALTIDAFREKFPFAAPKRSEQNPSI